MHSMRNCRLEVSTNGTTWTNISGWTNSVTVDGGERQTGETYVFGADTPTITLGPREPLTVTVKIVYDETTGTAYLTVAPVFESFSSAQQFWVRWSPRGGAAGQQMYTAAGHLTALSYPAGEMGGDPILVEFTVRAPQITRSLIV